MRPAFDAALSDVRLAARVLRRSPAHVLAVVGSLAIGAAIAIVAFSLLNVLVFKDVPGIHDRVRLARIYRDDGVPAPGSRGANVPQRSLSTADFDALAADRTSVFAALASEGQFRLSLSLPSGAVTAIGAFVSPDYFDTLGTTALAGRLLGAWDNGAESPPVVVIGHALWRDQLGSDPGAVGRSIAIGGREFAIVGVAPAMFTGLVQPEIGSASADSPQLWLPARLAAGWPGTPDRSRPWHSVAGRLAPGSTLRDARRVAPILAARLPADLSKRVPGSTPLTPRLVVFGAGASLRETPIEMVFLLALFLSLPLSILAIGCANAANLQLARAAHRSRELVVRLALGASRARLIRLLSLEALALSTLAGASAWILAALILRQVQAVHPLPLTLDAYVLGFTVALVLVVASLSGIAPAWIATRQIMAAALQQGAHAGSPAHSRLRSALVVGQVTLSVALLFICTLFVRSLHVIGAVEPSGAANVVIGSVDLSQVRYDGAKTRAFSAALLAALDSDGRIESAAFNDFGLWGYPIRYARSADDSSRSALAVGGQITPAWLESVNARLLSGRHLDRRDTDAGIISKTLADRLGADGPSPLGMRLRISLGNDARERTVEIVGIASDPMPSATGQGIASLYLPMPEVPPSSLWFFARTPRPDAVLGTMQATLRAVDPFVPLTTVGTQAGLLSRAAGPVRYSAYGLGLLSMLALVLAACGLYAVTAYVVSQRTREMAVRLAVGARPVDVTLLVMSSAVRHVAVGGVAGLALAMPFAWLLRSQFPGFSPANPLSFIPTVAILIAVAVAAAAHPAVRASRIDPVAALRTD